MSAIPSQGKRVMECYGKPAMCYAKPAMEAFHIIKKVQNNEMDIKSKQSPLSCSRKQSPSRKGKAMPQYYETELVIRAKPSDHQDQWDDFVANLRHISEETIIVPFHNLRPGLPEPKFTLMTQVDEHLSSKSYARYLTSALDCEKSFFPIGADEAGLFQGMYLNLSNLPGKKAMPTCWVHEAVEHLSSAYYSDSKRFVKTIFNGNGTVRKVHISSTPDDNKPKGFVGNWGRELENCGVLILSWVEIDKRFRGRGFGKMLMEKMLECAIKTSQRRGQGQVKFMIVYPEVIRSDLNQDLTAGGFRKAEAQVYINAVGFYRSIGFRRIASTRWYGYALDPNHP